MTTVLYISTFQFSGSTLISFLLNMHSDITTVGHTTGWNFGENEDFRCSCGAKLDDCPLYQEIAHAYATNSLPFDVRNFGTAYRLFSNERINRTLTAAIPLCHNSAIEGYRDAFVRAIPSFAKKLRICDQSNAVFMQTALAYNNASVFADNSHDPYRLRNLMRVRELDLRHMHLIRDPRGVAFSSKKNSGWPVDLAMRLWMRRHMDIIRISREVQQDVRVYYEDLCRDTNKALSRIHEFVDLDPQQFNGDFKEREHHILGNAMRLSSGDIRLDTRWQSELNNEELQTIAGIARTFVSKNEDDDMTKILLHYFDDL